MSDPTQTDTPTAAERLDALRAAFLRCPIPERRVFAEWLAQGGSDAPVAE